MSLILRPIIPHLRQVYQCLPNSSFLAFGVPCNATVILLHQMNQNLLLRHYLTALGLFYRWISLFNFFFWLEQLLHKLAFLFLSDWKFASVVLILTAPNLIALMRHALLLLPDLLDKLVQLFQCICFF